MTPRPPTPPVCRNGRWTEFFDVDNPSGNADSEQLSHINRVRPNRACSNPSAIDVQLLNGSDYRTAGQVVTVRRNGFTCDNRRQPNNRRCLDYKVRFCCPREFLYNSYVWMKYKTRLKEIQNKVFDFFSRKLKSIYL